MLWEDSLTDNVKIVKVSLHTSVNGSILDTYSSVADI